MNSGKIEEGIVKAAEGTVRAGLVATLAGVLALTSANAAAAAAKSGEDNRVVSYHSVDRAEIENLQRWVAAGHEDWCKDPRLVAAEELKRIASDFAGDGAELSAVELGESTNAASLAKKVAFEWTPLDGRATYRVTVERFEWLLPIAKNADAAVWVPTMTEIQIHE